MKTWMRYLIMAVIAFGLGAGLAYYQSTRQAPPQVSAEVAQKIDEATGRVAEPVTAVAEHDHEHAAAPVPETKEPVAGVQVGGPFSLINHKGEPVTEQSWPGKHKLVFFGFTHCPDICIIALEKISLIMNELDKSGEKLVPLFVTVDPTRDTPAVITGFLSKYNPHVVGLTGSEKQITDMQSAYKVYSAKIQPGEDPHAYMMNHSSYVYLMSPDDKLLAILGSEEAGEAMIAKIKLHMQ